MRDNVFRRWKLHAWLIVGTAVLCFAAGGSLTASRMRIEPVRSDNNRVFELCIYHAVPGKGRELEAVWRDASRIVAQHGIRILGYWVPNEDPAWKDTFVYVVEFASREDADKQWQSLHSDPAFRPYIEAAKPFIERTQNRFHVDEIYMRPTDFSEIR